MSTRKIIYIRKDIPASKGKVWANVHYMVGYNQGKISDYMEMADEMRKTFPQIKNSKVGCHHVIKSMTCQGFTLATWDGLIDLKDYEDWHIVRNGVGEYNWQ